MVEFLRVGTIASTHGIRGEVKVFPTTDDVKRFKKLKHCFLDTGKERIPLEVESVKFFKGKDLLVDRANAVKLAKDEYFIADLIGLKVVTDEGKDFGTLKDVLQTGANDVYVIDGTDGKEYLFPVIRECVLDVSLEKGIVTVHIMPGLLDL